MKIRNLQEFINSLPTPLTKQQVKFLAHLINELGGHHTPHNSMALVWMTGDVQGLVRRCSESDAMAVLHMVRHHHDAEYGVNWGTLRHYAEELGLILKKR